MAFAQVDSWFFLAARVHSSQIFHSFGHPAGVYCIVRSLCHVWCSCVGFIVRFSPELHDTIKYVCKRLDLKQQIIRCFIILHTTARGTQRRKWCLSNGLTISFLDSFFSTFAHCGYVFLYRLTEKWVWLLFKTLKKTLDVSINTVPRYISQALNTGYRFLRGLFLCIFM